MRVATEPTTEIARDKTWAGFSPSVKTGGTWASDALYFAPLIANALQVLRTEYRDLEAIGPGRSGFVFRARPIGAADAAEREDWVALKVAFHGVAESSGVYRRFLRIASVGAKLHHPHIAQVSRIRSKDGVTWFEMPFLGGLRLDRVLRNERTLTMAHTIGILREVASALDYAATQGIAHGALRPSEIVVQPDGHAVLSGFLLDPLHRDVHPALALSALGDPAYMAPEQWADSPTTGPAADQYALAILAAELIGGAQRVTRGERGVPEVVPLAIGRDRALRPGLGLHVNEALLRATSRDPALRFPSCSMFVAALGDPARSVLHAPEALPAPTIVPRASHWRLVLVTIMLLAALALNVLR